MLKSTAVLTGEGVDFRREREQSAKINCSTHGLRCRLKRENKIADIN